MKIHSKKIMPTDIDGFRKLEAEKSGEFEWKVQESPFLYLSTELPPPPLFKDEHHENIIPQVNFDKLMTKFNGKEEKEYKTYKDNFLKRFEITRLPR